MRPKVFPSKADYACAWLIFLMCAAFCAVVLLVPGCSPAQTYVEADMRTYRAVWPEYEYYFMNDASMDSPERENRQRTGRAWKARIERAR